MLLTMRAIGIIIKLNNVEQCIQIVIKKYKPRFLIQDIKYIRVKYIAKISK